MLDFQILFNRMNFERSKTPIIQNDRITIYYLHLFVIFFFFILNLRRSVRVTPLLPRKKIAALVGSFHHILYLYCNTP